MPEKEPLEHLVQIMVRVPLRLKLALDHYEAARQRNAWIVDAIEEKLAREHARQETPADATD